MRWTAAALLRPVTFVLAIVAAVVTGNRTDSFWYGLLAFFIAMGAGRVLGALVRGRPDKALYKAIWPVAATGYAFLFDCARAPALGDLLRRVDRGVADEERARGSCPKQRRICTRRVELAPRST